MPISAGLTTTIPASASYYRITSLAFYTSNPSDYVKVVDGQGGVRSAIGARYNFPGALTVYLTEDIETCLAEKMFYFQREILRGIDAAHHPGGVIPPFLQKFVLWEIKFRRPIADVFDMVYPGAVTYFNIFPSLVVNPSQDYEHLKSRRAQIQSNGYRGLRAGSSRATNGGNLIALFEDQSANLATIMPYEVEFRLIVSTGGPFYNHAHDLLDFTRGEVKIASNVGAGASSPYLAWKQVKFNH